MKKLAAFGLKTHDHSTMWPVVCSRAITRQWSVVFNYVQPCTTAHLARLNWILVEVQFIQSVHQQRCGFTKCLWVLVQPKLVPQFDENPYPLRMAVVSIMGT